MAISSAWMLPSRGLVDPEAPERLVWESWTQGVWSASGQRGLVGLVELEGGRFSATSEFGHPLGSFDSLSEAQASVVAADAAVRLLDDDRLAPRSTATIALVTVVSAVAFASLVGAWLTSFL